MSDTTGTILTIGISCGNKQLTRAQLIDGCIAKDSKSQLLLYKEFYGKMMPVCLRYAADEDEAKDILQEGFIKVFDKIRTYNQSGSLEGWIKKIITNTAIDFFRKNRSYRELFDKNKLPDVSEENDDDESALHYLAHLHTHDIIKVLQNLTPVYRTVVNLFYIDGLNHKQIAERLEISESTSRSNLVRAKVKLRELLQSAISEKNGK